MSEKQPTPDEKAHVTVLDVHTGGAASEDAISRAVAVLDGGGIVAVPTDTIYGLAASIHRSDALARLYTVKGRPEEKPLPILVADSSALDAVSEPPTEQLRGLLDQFWPGGLTVALPARTHIMAPLRAPDGTVGVRVPAHLITLALLRAAGGALAVTSANLSGQPPAITADQIVAALGARIDLVLDAGTAPRGEASTVIGVEEGRLRLYREGAIAWSELQCSWENAGGQVVAPRPGTVR